MSLFTVFAILITATALFAWLNERYLRLPGTIGVMVAAMVASLLLIAAAHLGVGGVEWARVLLERVDFDDLLMKGMLSFLLFAGALHVNLEDLVARRWGILSLATVGIAISTVLVGTATWLMLRLVGLEIPYLHALLFGALISPTDPIAVLGLLKRVGTPKSLEAVITGESLFNDGVGVVIFLMLLGLATGGHEVSVGGVVQLFAVEVVGGILLGFALGYAGYLLLKRVNNYMVEILVTLALVAGGYSLAGALHASGPLAMVVAGLFIGNRGRLFAMSDHTREHLDNFWKLLDEILNAVLFVLIGLEILVLDLDPAYLVAGLLAIPVVLGARLFSVGLPIKTLARFRDYPPRTVTMMTWGGLRGGISIALALSLPSSVERDLIVVVTYVVVIFSILVQGLTVGRVARWATATGRQAEVR
jgi:CPA1 family monovalent cation:H+ antiporter